MNLFSHWLKPDEVAIFLFHGVIRERRHEVRNYTGKNMLEAEFRAVLEDLQAHGNAVSMQDVVDATHSGEPLPPHAFSITFDDGFDNNRTVVAPILEEMKIPGCFYVTTRFIDENASSWIDMIEYAVEREKRFTLRLPHPTLCGTYGTRDEKIALLNEVRRIVKSDSSLDPYRFVEEFWSALGVREMEPDPDLDQKMNWAQVDAMARHPLFVVGGHSHTHRVMAFLPDDELQAEIDTSMGLLREHVTVPITHYSYPEGQAQHFSERVIQLLQQQGIVCSPTAMDGTNRIGREDLFHLWRVMVA